MKRISKRWSLSFLFTVLLVSAFLVLTAPRMALADEAVLFNCGMDETLGLVVIASSISKNLPGGAGLNLTPTATCAEGFAQVTKLGCNFKGSVEVEPGLPVVKDGGVKLADPRPSPGFLFLCPTG